MNPASLRKRWNFMPRRAHLSLGHHPYIRACARARTPRGVRQPFWPPLCKALNLDSLPSPQTTKLLKLCPSHLISHYPPLPPVLLESVARQTEALAEGLGTRMTTGLGSLGPSESQRKTESELMCTLRTSQQECGHDSGAECFLHKSEGLSSDALHHRQAWQSGMNL